MGGAHRAAAVTAAADPPVRGQGLGKSGRLQRAHPPDEVTEVRRPRHHLRRPLRHVPQAAVVDALVGLAVRFLPNRSRVLGGLLHRDASIVAGASGTLADRQNRIAASQTV